MSSWVMRLAWIQFFKRCPINLRRLALVPAGQNPKGLALFASAMFALNRGEEARNLIDRLLDLRLKGLAEACWGYNFDWQTRTYLISKNTPNVICTAFACGALLDAFDQCADASLLETAASAGRFVLKDLKRTGNNGEFCFSYTPLRPSLVHNASLIAAALLARLYAHTREKEMREAAIAAAQYSIRRQKVDGSWPYGEDKNQQWVDSFHTGYNLLALHDIHRYADFPPAEEALNKGFAYYRANFFPGDGIVKYFSDRVYPIDIHASAHAIVTLSVLREFDPGNLSLAQSILDWTVKHMRHPSGYFYYQKWPWMTVRIPYMRWSQAWMLYAMACFTKAATNCAN